MSAQVSSPMISRSLPAGCASPTSIAADHPKVAHSPDRDISDSCGVVGTYVAFPDGSRWLVQNPLSEMKFQRTTSPCEATQVFDVRCFEDPFSDYHVGQEAVIKIKFQIKALESTERHYQKRIAESEKYLSRQSEITAESRKKYEARVERVNRTRLSMHLCTHPAMEVHQDTANEIFALRHLADEQCQHAPWLLDFIETSVMPCDHPLGIVGGYYVVILMTKVPGVRLSWQYLSELSPTERDEIREAFKIALMDVWNCGIVPHDTALRNIMWDPEERKCYIIDYEECDIVEGEVHMPEKFTDKQFEWWNLAERRFCLNTL